jgi:hypothetical protein
MPSGTGAALTNRWMISRVGETGSSNAVSAKPVVERVQLASDLIQSTRIVRLERLIAFGPQRPHPCLRCGLVEAVHHMMVRVRVDPKRLANGGKQMILVHLRIPLYGLVIETLGDFPQLGYGLLVEFFVRHGHGKPSSRTPTALPPGVVAKRLASKPMGQVYAGLAGLIVLVHLAFVAFAAGGALLVLRWPIVAWVHVPAVAWAAFIEFSGGICPLTPLENELRAKAGLDFYAGDFVARYLFPVLYPEGLTGAAQVVIGATVLALNALMYALVYTRWRSFRR